MVIGAFMKSGSLAALVATLAILSVPANAQERGQGRWNRGGSGEAAAQGNGSGGGNWRGNRDNGGGNWQGGGARRGFSSGQATATPTPAPQPQVQAPPQQRNWSRGDGSSGQRWNGGNRGNDNASRWRGQAQGQALNPVTPPPQAQNERRNWSGSGSAGSQWQGRNRSYVDPNRNGSYRDTARGRDDGNRWRDDGNRRGNSAWGNNSWQGNRQGYAGNWNRDWRRDNRYDWRGYRSSNRDTYRLGAYYAPYRNYSYRRLSSGIYLDSLFFGSRYLIDDPWQYRLPPADGPYRWVRYYDDAMLVDTYSGEVIDVIYDFFW